jgi:hypothetical protein
MPPSEDSSRPLGAGFAPGIAVDVLQCFPAHCPLWRQVINPAQYVCKTNS